MRRCIEWTVASVVILLVLSCLGVSLPIESLFFLTIGWAFFLQRVLPNVTIDWPATATAAVALTLFVGGLHLFLRWLSAARRPEETSSPTSDGTMHTTRDWRFRWTAAISGGIVLMFVAGTAMIGLTHQLVWLSRSPEPLLRSGGMETMRGTTSRSNLRNIGLGLMQYDESHGTLPAGGTVDQHGRMLHGWQTMLLPYIDQGKLFVRINVESPWTAPENAEPLKTNIQLYRVPPRDNSGDYTADGHAVTEYAGNVHLLGPGRARNLAEISDGTFNTILVGEAVQNRKAWGDPTNWRDLREGLNTSPTGFGGPWRQGGVNVVFADGHARFISDKIDPKVLKALATPTGGEELTEADWMD